MTDTSVALPWAGGRRAAGARAGVRAAGWRRSRGILELLEDGVLLLLLVFLLPLGILLVGSPIAMFLRAVVELVQRF
ncbi:MAG TPA: hypothetical protein VK886_01770 [Vicinamibacterales bacterium]|nr:hypothetical protein [Vicinamibacterales bacterium]